MSLVMEGEKLYEKHKDEFISPHCGTHIAIVDDYFTGEGDKFYFGSLEEDAVGKARKEFPEAGVYVRIVMDNCPPERAVLLPGSDEYKRNIAYIACPDH